MREIRTYRKVRETESDRKHGVMVPVGFEMRVSQGVHEADMDLEGYERVGETSCTCGSCGGPPPVGPGEAA